MFKGEWLLIDDVLKKYAGSQPVCFVEIGANDGIRGDHLNYWIQNFGWTGLMCEPLKVEFSVLEKLYSSNPNIHTENVAIHSFLKELTLYVPKLEKRRGTASIFKKNRNIWRHRKRLEKITAPCCTAQSLIDKHSLNQFKVLQIDVEGAELEVLKSIDLNKNCPDIINYEHKHIRKLGFEKDFQRILSKFNFELHEYSMRDTVAIRSGVISTEVMQGLRKKHGTH